MREIRMVNIQPMSYQRTSNYNTNEVITISICNNGQMITKACAGQNGLAHCWRYLLLQTFDEVSWHHEKQKYLKTIYSKFIPLEEYLNK